MKPLLITIDGPAGAGKTTVSRMLAERLEYCYIDTGAIYRALAFKAISEKIALDDEKKLEQICKTLDIKFVLKQKENLVFLNNEDITNKIRTPEVTMFTSAVSAIPIVREHLMKIQKNMAITKKAIFEGRDMGTVVFPDADIKFFLNASLKKRAMRRHNEIKNKHFETPEQVELEQVERDICKRDKNDTNRPIAPLKPAHNATIIDSTHLSAEQVVDLMLCHIKKVS